MEISYLNLSFLPLKRKVSLQPTNPQIYSVSPFSPLSASVLSVFTQRLHVPHCSSWHFPLSLGGKNKTQPRLFLGVRRGWTFHPSPRFFAEFPFPVYQWRPRAPALFGGSVKDGRLHGSGRCQPPGGPASIQSLPGESPCYSRHPAHFLFLSKSLTRSQDYTAWLKGSVKSHGEGRRAKEDGFCLLHLPGLHWCGPSCQPNAFSQTFLIAPTQPYLQGIWNTATNISAELSQNVNVPKAYSRFGQVMHSQASDDFPHCGGASANRRRGESLSDDNR